MERIVCVVGPTASGKTELAIRLAAALDGEIVSCDSMQIYRGMDIGTAKPTAQEQARAVHHMIDVAAPDEQYSVGKYVEQADACVQDILARGRAVIVVGGTGLYAESLMAGRSFAPIPSTGVRAELETRLAAEGGQTLLAELAQVDPDAAARLHPADGKRIVRALEVYRETGRTITEHNAQTQREPPRYSPIWLGLDFSERAALYARIDRRVQLMRAAGLDAEVRGLLDAGLSANATAMQAIGYKELAQCEQGTLSRDAAYALIAQRSRNYAKRQLTWFRRNQAMHWIVRTEADTDETIFAAARQEIRFFAE